MRERTRASRRPFSPAMPTTRVSLRSRATGTPSIIWGRSAISRAASVSGSCTREKEREGQEMSAARGTSPIPMRNARASSSSRVRPKSCGLAL